MVATGDEYFVHESKQQNVDNEKTPSQSFDDLAFLQNNQLISFSDRSYESIDEWCSLLDVRKKYSNEIIRLFKEIKSRGISVKKFVRQNDAWKAL